VVLLYIDTCPYLVCEDYSPWLLYSYACITVDLAVFVEYVYTSLYICVAYMHGIITKDHSCKNIIF